MEDPIAIAWGDPAIKNWIKWVVILLATRSPKPFLWSSFLSLHPKIRQLLLHKRIKQSLGKWSDGVDVERRLKKTSNLVSCAILYFAASTNTRLPSDYLSIYLWINYYGILNPPSASSIMISPQYSKYLKIEYYKNDKLMKLYNNKEYIIYPMIFGQILSNYLTPTKYKLNQRYLSTSIKSRILNPIWINYSLGVNSEYLNWVGLLKSYTIHHLMLGTVVGLYNFKDRLVDRYYALKYKITRQETIAGIIKNFVMYVFHVTNSLINFAYVPNLIAIFLISLTAPMFAYLSNANFPVKGLRVHYMNHTKQYFKGYTRLIGFIAAFITIYLNDINIVPDVGYNRKKQLVNVKIDDLSYIQEEEEVKEENIRKISKSFINALNLYLFRLILLSKWRITKENHPSFSSLKLSSWRKLEALLACYGVYKVMNLNDFIKSSPDPRQYDHLRKETLIRVVDRIM
ncbi:uncharacterized protein RJT21DRAFT_139208 [Scheffersomyces amazonensis]|uniref:uncharacterized protein n=1 Tax=Scheffersomyces amazonensis TaxID=1078765 RepID=UPI00315D5BB4